MNISKPLYLDFFICYFKTLRGGKWCFPFWVAREMGDGSTRMIRRKGSVLLASKPPSVSLAAQQWGLWEKHTENQNSHLVSFSDLNRRGVNDCRTGGSQCAYTVGYSKHEPTPEGSQTSLGDGYSEVIFKYLTKQPFFIHEVTSKLLFRGSPTEQNNFLLHLHFYNILFMTTLWHLTHLF